MFDFEKPLVEIKTKIEELKKISSESGMDLSKEIEKFEQQADEYQQEIYSSQRRRLATTAKRSSSWQVST